MLHPMTDETFRRISLYSFRNHVANLVRSTGLDPAEIEAESGGPATSRSDDDVWFTVRDDEIEVGYLWLRLDRTARRAYCMDVHVMAPARGRGVGRRVMNAAIDRLADEGFAALDLTVRRDNAAACGLYRSLGFEPGVPHGERDHLRLTRALPQAATGMAPPAARGEVRDISPTSA